MENYVNYKRILLYSSFQYQLLSSLWKVKAKEMKANGIFYAGADKFKTLIEFKWGWNLCNVKKRWDELRFVTSFDYNYMKLKGGLYSLSLSSLVVEVDRFLSFKNVEFCQRIQKIHLQISFM